MAHRQVLGFVKKPCQPHFSLTPQLASIGGVRHAYNPPQPRRSGRYNGVSRQVREEQSEEVRALEKNFTRDWKVGDVYAPHDLSAAEARKWKARKAPTTDAFDALSVNPLNLYKNFSVMAEYVTDLGRIRPRSQTGLRPVNQRRLAKAIRRSIALGLTPSVYRHPELLKIEKRRINSMR